MAKSPKKLQTQRQSATRRLSLFNRAQTPKKSRASGRSRKFLITQFPAQLSLSLNVSAKKANRKKPTKKAKRPSKTKLVLLSVFPAPLRIRYNSQTALTAVIIGLGMAGVVYFGIQTFKPETVGPSVTAGPTQPVVLSQTQKAYSLGASLPTHLRVESVGINTDLIELGKLADGSLETPTRFDIAGWYKYSPTPGEIGPSVIVGHVDNYRGAAVFWPLKDLKAGAIIEVTRADGSLAKFSVYDIQSYPQANFPTESVYGNINYSGLRLITCGGTFNHLTHQYDHNTVVYASLTR